MMTVMRTAQLKKVPFLNVILYTNLHTADQQVPHLG